MATRLRRIGWALAFLLLGVFGIPWFLWGVDTIVFGLPVWLWWHIGVMVGATLLFWLFARTDWGIWIEPDPTAEPDGKPTAESNGDRGGDGI